jgi:hypothetical protein
MARGSLAKENITKALLSIFPNSFVAADGKTIRIPTTCEGETIEIKCSLTAAKDLEGGGQANFSAVSDQPIPQNTELTEEEITEVRNLIAELNL